jgi:serine phosphatase RsbU (regulator of sigma subunit)
MFRITGRFVSISMMCLILMLVLPSIAILFAEEAEEQHKIRAVLIQGKVYHPDTHSLWDNVKVEVEADSSDFTMETTTDSTGRYSFVVTPGSYTIQADTWPRGSDPESIEVLSTDTSIIVDLPVTTNGPRGIAMIFVLLGVSVVFFSFFPLILAIIDRTWYVNNSYFVVMVITGMLVFIAAIPRVNLHQEAQLAVFCFLIPALAWFYGNLVIPGSVLGQRFSALKISGFHPRQLANSKRLNRLLRLAAQVFLFLIYVIALQKIGSLIDVIGIQEKSNRMMIFLLLTWGVIAISLAVYFLLFTTADSSRLLFRKVGQVQLVLFSILAYLFVLFALAKADVLLGFSVFALAIPILTLWRSKGPGGTEILFRGYIIAYPLFLLHFFSTQLNCAYCLLAGQVGTVVLAVSAAISLGRELFFSRAENIRKTQELEEARQLQFSMLPHDKPSLPHLDISWYMITATEVGGDYYDYSLADDGGITITLGDATGHGMQAGTVVTATKSLFQNFADQPVITETFSAMSRSLKGMNFPRLGMAMTMVKITDHKLQISSAGIPPALLYRAATKEIEEIEIGGMPLGYSTSFQYQQEEYDLNPGDTLVLMSDGLPERLNDQDEELGYPKTQELFREAAERTPEEICQHLAQGGDEWAKGRIQDDDVTFVVLKVK